MIDIQSKEIKKYSIDEYFYAIDHLIKSNKYLSNDLINSIDKQKQLYKKYTIIKIKELLIENNLKDIFYFNNFGTEVRVDIKNLDLLMKLSIGTLYDVYLKVKQNIIDKNNSNLGE